MEEKKKNIFSTFEKEKDKLKKKEDKEKAKGKEYKELANTKGSIAELNEKISKEKEKEKSIEQAIEKENFTSNIDVCEIKSPNNITAGYMNSIDNNINSLCNNPNPNDCSLVKSTVTGGVQYIESKSMRKSNGEFSGVTEWVKQTQS